MTVIPERPPLMTLHASSEGLRHPKRVSKVMIVRDKGEHESAWKGGASASKAKVGPLIYGHVLYSSESGILVSSETVLDVKVTNGVPFWLMSFIVMEHLEVIDWKNDSKLASKMISLITRTAEAAHNDISTTNVMREPSRRTVLTKTNTCSSIGRTPFLSSWKIKITHDLINERSFCH